MQGLVPICTATEEERHKAMRKEEKSHTLIFEIFY
jgi:hypothetical protein